MLNSALFNQQTELSTYHAKVWRMVETQETTATLHIVDSMEEQAVLEELLDQVKPPYRKGTEGMHYLFKTAFRYPPLKYGSRFGTRLLPSFFYASEAVVTALAETAYYRFIFLDDMQTEYTKEIDSAYSLFSASVRSQRCLDLRSEAFSDVQQQLVDPQHYAFCQTVGEWAVNQQQVEVIRTESARWPDGTNVAIAEPNAIHSKFPSKMQTWLCRTTASKVSFSSREASSLHSFLRDDFTVEGKLPRPA